MHVDWCCFYYFVRNSLVALLEATGAVGNHRRGCASAFPPRMQLYTFIQLLFENATVQKRSFDVLLDASMICVWIYSSLVLLYLLHLSIRWHFLCPPRMSCCWEYGTRMSVCVVEHVYFVCLTWRLCCCFVCVLTFMCHSYYEINMYRYSIDTYYVLCFEYMHIYLYIFMCPCLYIKYTVSVCQSSVWY